MYLPDKIYVDTIKHPNLDDFDDNRWHYNSAPGNKSIEYIKTDAVIEKVQNFFRQSPYLFRLDGMDLHNFIEDFRTYMKGE